MAPVNDEAKKHNQNLPGMGGIYNTVNFHLYHYAGNNPVKYTDPDGRYSVKQFFADLKFGAKTTFNFDFGLDCDRYATQCWQNGDYLNAAIWTLDSAAEKVLDVAACYFVAELVEAAVEGASMALSTTSIATGLSATKITQALSDTGRVQHASRHLINSGILPNWSKNTAELAKNLYTNILSSPEKTFDYTLKSGELCDGFSKTVDGQKIIVLLYKIGESAGQIATSFVANQNQIEKLGL